MDNFYIVGAGGVGSFLCPVICKLVGPQHVTIIDGDKLEHKNLDRQLFNPDDVGQNKARALSALYDCGCLEGWYFDGFIGSRDGIPLTESDWLLVCVDNHPARKAALESCDSYGCRAIFGGNETTSSEAFLYQQDWKGSKLDPRVYYPEINTSTTGDPMRVAAGCTGQFQEQNRQLVTANFMAAGLMGHLLMVWHLEAPKLNKETREYLPFHLTQNLSRNENKIIKDHATKKD